MTTAFRRHLYPSVDTDPARLCACGAVPYRDYVNLWHAAGAPALTYDSSTCDPPLEDSVGQRARRTECPTCALSM